MLLKDQKGLVVNYDVSKYLVDWDEKVSRGKNGQFGKRQWEVKQFLRPYWKDFFILEEFKLPRSRLSIDLVNLSTKQSIEVNGEFHLSYHPVFHKTKLDFYKQKRNDMFKEDFCKINGFDFIEIFPADGLNEKTFLEKGVIL